MIVVATLVRAVLAGTVPLATGASIVSVFVNVYPFHDIVDPILVPLTMIFTPDGKAGNTDLKLYGAEVPTTVPVAAPKYPAQSPTPVIFPLPDDILLKIRT